MLRSNVMASMFGPSAARDVRRTARAWRQTEAAWRISPLAQAPRAVLAERALAQCPPAGAATPIVGEALAALAAQLLALEDVGEIEVDWGEISADPAALAAFRRVLARRHRWAANPGGGLAAVAEIIAVAATAVANASPEACRGDPGREAVFELPLMELLDRPGEAIERLLFAPYTDENLDHDRFARLRRALERNLAIASALPPRQGLEAHPNKIVLPVGQKGRSARELVDLYLTGTPFHQFLATRVPFSIPESVRAEHAIGIAGTGHGKTQLLQLLIHRDLVAAQRQRRSVVVIDSQGDLVDRLGRLALFAPGTTGSLADRLILIDPEDVEHPPALNLFDAHFERLAAYRPVDRERVLNGVVELYETFFADLLGAELTQKQGVVFKYLARLMLAIPGATIATLMQVMEDGRPFREQMAGLDGSARHFFATEFFQPGFTATKRQILRRLWGVLATPSFERMFTQPSCNARKTSSLLEGSVLLVNTAKDLLKTEGSQLFGRFIIKMIVQAALERSTIDPGDRTPTFIYVDEAHEYFDDSVETLLTQARKYQVSLTCVTQTPELLSPRLRAVLLANTSVKLVGGLSARDGRALADEMRTTPEFLESMRRRATHTEFALWVKDHTPHAIRLPVRLGHLEAQPRLSDADHAELIERNRARYCGTIGKAAFSGTIVDGSESAVDWVEPSPLPETIPAPAPRSARPTATQSSARPPTRAGGVGPHHRYLQQLIKQVAEESGFRAVIEEPADGGRVDIGLHREDLSVACEVSVGSAADYEVQTVARRLSAGFTQVWTICDDAKRRQAIQAAIRDELPESVVGSVSVMETAEAVAALQGLRPAQSDENSVLGYKVRVTRRSLSAEEAKGQRAAIARILAAAKRSPI